MQRSLSSHAVMTTQRTSAGLETQLCAAAMYMRLSTGSVDADNRQIRNLHVNRIRILTIGESESELGPVNIGGTWLTDLIAVFHARPNAYFSTAYFWAVASLQDG
jgi:hypothetical protein